MVGVEAETGPGSRLEEFRPGSQAAGDAGGFQQGRDTRRLGCSAEKAKGEARRHVKWLRGYKPETLRVHPGGGEQGRWRGGFEALELVAGQGEKRREDPEWSPGQPRMVVGVSEAGEGWVWGRALCHL